VEELNASHFPQVETTPPYGISPKRVSPEERRNFGSQVILEKLWAPDNLQGTTSESKIHYLSVPDFSPPPQSEPKEQPLEPPSASSSSIRRVQLVPQYKIVALTFDLCERANDITGYDAPIVNYLRAQSIHATFFAGGKWMRDHPERTMQLMADPLFEVGNHSWTHANLRLLTGQALNHQILWTQAQYELLRDELAHRARQRGIEEEEIAQIPLIPQTFRFPYGVCSPEALRAVADAGLAAIQWDVVSGDPAPRHSVSQMVERVVQHTKPGSILIFHANGRGHGTAEAIPRIVAGLRERGFKFATVSELLHFARQTGAVITAVPACYEQRPGDNQRYDRLVGKDSNNK
jgi:peptidoglycan/xylan/chitin deacetylase (PgdA/CDA1 family)